jgi:hypothetical protein
LNVLEDNGYEELRLGNHNPDRRYSALTGDKGLQTAPSASKEQKALDNHSNNESLSTSSIMLNDVENIVIEINRD